MKIRSHIDWLSTTFPRGMVDLPRGWGESRTEDRGGMGYKQQTLFANGARLFHGVGMKHCHLQMSGEALWHIGHRDATSFIYSHVANGARVTRIDLAVTGSVEPGGVMPFRMGEVARAVKSGRAATSAKKHHIHVSQSGGMTVEIGSRTSRKYVRVYDKGIEALDKGDLILARENPNECIRVELEYKDKDTGGDVLEQVMRDPGAIPGIIKTVFDMPGSKGWSEMMAGEDNALPEKPRKHTDTGAWLMGPVVSAAGKHFANPANADEYLLWLQAVTREVEEQRKAWR